MGIKTLGVLGALALAAAVMLAPAAGAQGVKVGDQAPDFKLKDLDGQEHTLAEYKGKPVVLVFVSKECPWSRGADPVLSQLVKDYEGKAVILGIDANKDNKPEDIKEYAKQNNLAYTILKDEKNRYADQLGAKKTPEVFLLDAEGKVVYHGAVDDRQKENEEGKTNFVRQALGEVLAGKPVSVPEKNTIGCGIQRVKES
jgi:peroxiredoxin